MNFPRVLKIPYFDPEKIGESDSEVGQSKPPVMKIGWPFVKGDREPGGKKLFSVDSMEQDSHSAGVPGSRSRQGLASSPPFSRNLFFLNTENRAAAWAIARDCL